MSRKLVIDPVTRIEGHGKVVVHLDDDNNVVDAKLHVVEFRGFERFIQGHPYWEAPVLLQRICGICFVSHHLCGAKALDDMVGLGLKQGFQVTPTAEKMRRLGHYAQMLQSHQTAYFYLIVPEMMFGMDAAPEQRNIEGLIEANPELVKRAVMLRKWGQEMLVAVFGKRMHGISSIPGGVNKNLSVAERDRFLNGAPGLLNMQQVIDYSMKVCSCSTTSTRRTASRWTALAWCRRSTCAWSMATAMWTITTATCASPMARKKWWPNLTTTTT